MTSTYIPTSQAAKAPDSIFWLEKESQPGRTTLQDIKGALDEYERNYHAGTISKAEMMTLHRAFPDSPTYAEAAGQLQKMDMVEPLVIGGPASVELIDREGHLITAGALGRAFQKFMDNERTRNVMVLHSDVQVGWALPAYISKGGQIYKSGVDDKGLFFICELRNDTAIAKKVADQINDGLLKSYSIAGSATKVQNMKKGMTPYMQVDEMELAEVTVCEKGVNQAANFEILKAELPQSEKADEDQKDSEKEERLPVAIHRKIVIMRSEDNGKINFKKSFLNWMEKESKDPLKGKSFTTLENLAGREAEHHRLLEEYGFPSEPILETMRYIPVVETETDDDGKPINIIPPWVVNEAGQDLGDKLDNDKIVSFNKSIDIFERIIQKATAPPKRMGKANPGQAFPEGEKPKDTGLGMGVTPATMLGMGDPAGKGVPPQTDAARANEGMFGQAQLGREYPPKVDLPTTGASSRWYPSAEASTRAANVSQAPFPGASPSGVAAQASADATHAENLRTGGPGLARARERSERVTRQVPEQEAAAAQKKIEQRRDNLRYMGVNPKESARRKEQGNVTTTFDDYEHVARGRQAGTPVETQSRRQPLQGPGIRYRMGDDTASRNRADALREVREEQTGRREYDAGEIVGSVQSQRRRDRMENLSPREKAHQGMRRLFRGGRKAGREVDQNLQDLRGEVQGVAGEMGRGFRDEEMRGDKGADWANQAARGIGRGARRGAEAAGGAFRGFMNPQQDVRPDIPAEAAGVRGEGGRFRSPAPAHADERLGAGSRERGGQVGRMVRQRGGQAGRMARQWLGRQGERAGKIGGEIARGVSSGVDDLENLREYYRPGGIRSEGGLRQRPGKSYGRAAELERQQGVGQGVQYHPDEHRNMSSSERHDNVRSKLDHIQDGGKLSPRDWMGVIHHLSQNEDGDRLAHFTDMNFHPDEWHQPIGMAEMREHLSNKVRAHHGRHGGSGAQALRQIVETLHNSNDNGHYIDLKRLQGEPEQAERGLMGGGQASTPDAWEQARARVRGPRDYGRGRRPTARGAARRPAWAQNREPIKYSIENSMPVHKIFAKAFSLPVRS